MLSRQGTRTPEELVGEYKELGAINEELEKAEKLVKIHRKQKKIEDLKKLRARPNKTTLHRSMVMVPEEISRDIDAFCERFHVTRSAWFNWAVASQYLTYKKMMLEAEGDSQDATDDQGTRFEAPRPGSPRKQP